MSKFIIRLRPKRTMYTLRVILSKSSEAIVVGTELEKQIKSQLNISDYFFHLEIGERECVHFQGWLYSTLKPSTWQNQRDNKLRGYLIKTSKNKYALSLANYPDTWPSYIYKNPTKSVEVPNYIFFTNISSYKLEAMPIYSAHVDPDKKICWSTKMLKVLEETCLVPTLVPGEFRINYLELRHRVYQNLGHINSIDECIIFKMMNALTYKLELKYPCSANRRYRDKVDRYGEERYGDVYYEQVKYERYDW